MKKIVFASLAIISLSGCNTTQRVTVLEIGLMNNEQRCEYAQRFDHDFLTYDLISSQKGLYCHPAQKKCIDSGIPANHQNFKACVYENLETLNFPAGSSITKSMQEDYFGTDLDCFGGSEYITCAVRKIPYK